MRAVLLLVLLISVGCAQNVSEAPVAGQAILEGSFTDGDSFHRGSGFARVYTQAGQQTLRLEDFKVTAGPDLYVWLTKPGGVGSDYLEIGPLKGSQGNQNYALPSGTNLSEYPRVVIWCKAFSVFFASATLGPKP